MTDAKNLFQEIAPSQAEGKQEPYAVVMLVENSYRPGWDDRKVPPQKNASCFVFDGGVLPVFKADERLAVKNIVFANHDWMERVVNNSGFKDPEGNIWFFIPTNVRPKDSDAIWYRRINFTELIEHANIIKADKKELKKKIENVLIQKKQILTGIKQS